MDKLDPFWNNPTQDFIVESPVPEECTKEPCMLGIDEAGRGPVLGPMVYGIAYYPLSVKSKMKKMEFADSKVLTEEKREEIFNKLDNGDCGELGFICNILSPSTISQAALRRSKYNLNALSHDTAIGLVNDVIAKGVDVAELYVDTVGPKEKYQEKLKNIFPNIRKIVVENKADSKFEVVSAASICAKVIRDRTLKGWRFAELFEPNCEFGSGYPGDPKTKKFLQATVDPVFGFTSLVRFDWQTVKTILDTKVAVECCWEEEDEKEPEESVKSVPITNFFKRKADSSGSSSKKMPIHNFYAQRGLSVAKLGDFIAMN